MPPKGYPWYSRSKKQVVPLVDFSRPVVKCNKRKSFFPTSDLRCTTTPYCSAADDYRRTTGYHCCLCRDGDFRDADTTTAFRYEEFYALYQICGNQYLARMNFFDKYCEGCKEFCKANSFHVSCDRTNKALNLHRKAQEEDMRAAASEKKKMKNGSGALIVTEEDIKSNALKEWHANVDSRLEINFYLREVLCFELCGIVLAFALKVPLVRFFLIYDLPEKQTVKCGHPWCHLESNDRCCFCLDKRFEQQRDKLTSADVAGATIKTRWYIDGEGNYNGKLEFYQHYCPGCNDKYKHDGLLASTVMRDRLSVKEKP